MFLIRFFWTIVSWPFRAVYGLIRTIVRLIFLAVLLFFGLLVFQYSTDKEYHRHILIAQAQSEIDSAIDKIHKAGLISEAQSEIDAAIKKLDSAGAKTRKGSLSARERLASSLEAAASWLRKQ